MELNKLKQGQTAVVQTVGGDGALRQHFLDMGLIPGAEITLVKFAPMGDPIEFRIHGYELTLRVDDAKKIEIKPIKKTVQAEQEKRCTDRIEHPGLGENGKYHVKSSENPLPSGTVLSFCSCGQPKLRKDNTFQPVNRLKSACRQLPGCYR